MRLPIHLEVIQAKRRSEGGGGGGPWYDARCTRMRRAMPIRIPRGY